MALYMFAPTAVRVSSLFVDIPTQKYVPVFTAFIITENEKTQILRTRRLEELIEERSEQSIRNIVTHQERVSQFASLLKEIEERSEQPVRNIVTHQERVSQFVKFLEEIEKAEHEAMCNLFCLN
jgi:16S rRNA U1498 N3-methylase RsmE